MPFAQLVQPPGFFDNLSPNATSTPGLYLAGEYTTSSSIHGAMHSGEHAARALAQDPLTYGGSKQPGVKELLGHSHLSVIRQEIQSEKSVATFFPASPP